MALAALCALLLQKCAGRHDDLLFAGNRPNDGRTVIPGEFRAIGPPDLFSRTVGLDGGQERGDVFGREDAAVHPLQLLAPGCDPGVHQSFQRWPGPWWRRTRHVS